MPLPPLPPVDRNDGTLAAGAHADDHNKITAALRGLLEAIGDDPAAGYADLGARLGALPTRDDLAELLVRLAGSASAAADSETAAAGSAGAASDSAAAAAGSAGDAADSASAAASSAGAANDSASDAAGSAGAAATSESNASDSEAAAAQSATEAEGHAQSAAGSVSLVLWAPATMYAAGDVRQAPDGSTIRRLANGASGAVFDAAEEAAWESVLSIPTTIAGKALSASYGEQIETPGTPARDALDAEFAHATDIPNPRTVAASVVVPVAVPPMLANQASTTNYSTWRTATYKNKHIALTDITSLILVYGNYRVGTNAPDVDGAGDITVTCSVEAPDGSGNIRGFTASGARSATIGPGGEARFYVPVEIAAGTYFYTRSYVADDGSHGWPVGDVANNPKNGYDYDPVSHTSMTDNNEGANGPTGTDVTGPGASAPTTSAQYTFGPVQILGTAEGGRVNVVGLFGDSIASGGNDIIGVGGFERAAKTSLLPFINLARSSERASNFESQRVRETRVAYIKYVTHAIVEYARNDLNGSVTLATLQANSIALWTRLADQGIVVYHATALPKTTSTDGWVTLGNQTVTSDNTVRVNFNNWLRDGAPVLAGSAVSTGSSAPGTLRAGDPGHPLTDYIELADVLESSRDSGKWRVDGSRNVTVTSQANYQVVTHAAAALTSGDLEMSLVLPGGGSAGGIYGGQIGKVTSTATTLQSRVTTAVTSGTAVVGAARTADGTHPNAQGHKEIAAALASLYSDIKAS